MQIRLFTSGTHNGLNFSNTDINNIAAATASGGMERIPIVLGHPKNDLPVFGYLPKTAIRSYQEGDKVSLGFDRNAADLSEEALAAVRASGRNRISIRLEEGRIKHIGLVRRAAVEENNTQDFAALTGDFAAVGDFCETDDGPIWDSIKRFFKTKTNDFMSTEDQNNDFSALQAKVEGIGQAVGDLAKIITGAEEEKKKAARTATLTADFSAADFSHLTDGQREKAAALCARLTPEETEDYKATLRAGNRKPAKPADGSVTADFGRDGREERTAEEILRDQIDSVK